MKSIKFYQQFIFLYIMIKLTNNFKFILLE